MRSSLLLAAVVVSAVLLVAPWLMRRRVRAPSAGSTGSTGSTGSAGAVGAGAVDSGGGTVELRRQVLTRAMLRATPPDADPDAVRCVVMDWNIGGDRVATLVAFDDGTTSLYLSSGGGVIGAGAHAPVRAAAEAFRARAQEARSSFRPSSEDFELPGSDASVFYLVTNAATLTSGPLPNAELQSGRHPLSTLARSAQEVLSRVRAASP